MRCLLPIPVESYETWCVGVWIEVSQPDYERVSAAWDDLENYPALRFAGTIANELAATLDLPVLPGVPVELSVLEPDAPPRITASSDGVLAGILSTAWSKAKFERYAVARGVL